MEEANEEITSEITEAESDQEQQESYVQEEIPTGPQQVEVINTIESNLKWPVGIEGIDYEMYIGNNIALTVRKEITYGDILVSTLLAFLIVFMIIQFFHTLLLGGKK